MSKASEVINMYEVSSKLDSELGDALVVIWDKIGDHEMSATGGYTDPSFGGVSKSLEILGKKFSKLLKHFNKKSTKDQKKFLKDLYSTIE